MNLDWAAGFFDGEGTVGFWKTSNKSKKTGFVYKRLAAAVAQNSRHTLEEFHKAVGLGKISGPYKSTNGPNSHYRWHAFNGEVLELEEKLRGRLVGKQEQFDRAIDEYRAYKTSFAHRKS